MPFPEVGVLILLETGQIAVAQFEVGSDGELLLAEAGTSLVEILGAFDRPWAVDADGTGFTEEAWALEDPMTRSERHTQQEANC